VVAATCPDLTYAPAKAITERRAKGVIKAVNASGGYGFISCPDISQVFGCDVFAHAKQIGGLSPGTEVSFAILLNKDSKPQAFDIEELSPNPNMGKGKGAMMAMLGGFEQMSPMPSKGPPKGMVKGMGGQAFGDLGNFIGTIKNFNAEKGFGFLDIPALAGRVEGDVFLHGSNLGQFGPGSVVKCTVYLHNGRAQAKNLEEASAAEMQQAQTAPDVSMTGGAGMAGMPGMDMAGMGAMGKGMNSGFPGPGGTGHIPDQDLGQYVGSVKTFNASRGFGFITCDTLAQQGYPDVFVHQKHIGEHQVGELVAFTAFVHKGSHLQAKDLSAVSESAMPGMAGMPGMPAMKMPRLG